MNDINNELDIRKELDNWGKKTSSIQKRLDAILALKKKKTFFEIKVNDDLENSDNNSSENNDDLENNDSLENNDNGTGENNDNLDSNDNLDNDDKLENYNDGNDKFQFESNADSNKSPFYFIHDAWDKIQSKV